MRKVVDQSWFRGNHFGRNRSSIREHQSTRCFTNSVRQTFKMGQFAEPIQEALAHTAWTALVCFPWHGMCNSAHATAICRVRMVLAAICRLHSES